ncbi:MAG: hypothetical protein K0Q50_1896, partial [Vampirovibrio sp.]|nr:hypothetical protein [Vampirovibrio sp.]
HRPAGKFIIQSDGLTVLVRQYEIRCESPYAQWLVWRNRQKYICWIGLSKRQYLGWSLQGWQV